MRSQDKRAYFDLRQHGYRAQDAFRTARIVRAFASSNDVRLRVEPEEESYFDAYGEPDAYVDGNGRRVSAEQARKELIEMLDRDGVWIIVAEYRCPCCGEWTHADSIGMNAGYRDVLDPRENAYVPDLMQSALDALKKRQHHS